MQKKKQTAFSESHLLDKAAKAGFILHDRTARDVTCSHKHMVIAASSNVLVFYRHAQDYPVDLFGRVYRLGGFKGVYYQKQLEECMF